MDWREWMLLGLVIAQAILSIVIVERSRRTEKASRQIWANTNQITTRTNENRVLVRSFTELTEQALTKQGDTIAALSARIDALERAAAPSPWS